MTTATITTRSRNLGIEIFCHTTASSPEPHGPSATGGLKALEAELAYGAKIWSGGTSWGAYLYVDGKLAVYPDGGQPLNKSAIWSLLSDLRNHHLEAATLRVEEIHA